MRLWVKWWRNSSVVFFISSVSHPLLLSGTKDIFSIPGWRETHTPLSSMILSHPAKAAALGGSVKNVIFDHGYICLLSVVLGFCSSLFGWLYYKNYNILKVLLKWLWAIV